MSYIVGTSAETSLYESRNDKKILSAIEICRSLYYSGLKTSKDVCIHVCICMYVLSIIYIFKDIQMSVHDRTE